MTLSPCMVPTPNPPDRFFVTPSPCMAPRRQVLYACLETFEELKTDAPISHDNLDSAKKVSEQGVE